MPQKIVGGFQPTPITKEKCTTSGGRTKEANEVDPLSSSALSLMRDLLFSSINMAAITSRENLLYLWLKKEQNSCCTCGTHFFTHFHGTLHKYDVKKQHIRSFDEIVSMQMWTFLSLFLFWNQALTNLFLGYFAYIVQRQQDGVIA